jgi:branched-chain amino acid transport system permease protein
MSYWATQVLNGLSLGMALVLMSVGLSIIFGMMGIVNFAHGEFLLLGTYLAWHATVHFDSLVIGILGAGILVAVVGMGLERFLFRYTYDRSTALQLLLTFGLAEIMRELIQVIWGRNTKNFPMPSWGEGSVDLLFMTYPQYRLFIILFTAVLLAGVYLLLTRTDVGMVVRAGTYDRDMINILGIDINRTFLIVFGLGAGLAGIAGALLGPIRGAYPLLGVDLLIPAFVVVIVGGMGSVKGTVVAGLVIGQLMVLTGAVFSSLQMVSIFVLMAIVLLVKPEGLFGKEGVLDL